MNKISKIKALRKKIKNKNLTIGSWMQIPSTSVAEILGKSNYDWIAIDMEHGQIDNSMLQDLFRAIELGDTLAFARLPSHEIYHIKTALDSGAMGLIFPMVETSSQIRNSIAFSLYPPAGERGVGFSRANLFGKNFSEYTSEAENIFIVVMIETKKGYMNLSDILSVSRIDAVLIGPYDLSASLGCTGDFENKIFKDAIENIKEICSMNQIPCGFHQINPDKKQLLSKVDEGYKFIAYSTDAYLLALSARNPID